MNDSIQQRFTELSITAIFERISREQRLALKCRCPSLRFLHAVELLEQVEFRCNKPEKMKISVCTEEYHFVKNAKNNHQTEVSRFSNTMLFKPLEKLLLSLDRETVIKNFIKCKMSKKIVHIEELTVSCQEDVLSLFAPLEATIGCLFLRRASSPRSGALRSFENRLQKLDVWTHQNLTSELLDNILSLKVPELELVVDHFPTDKISELKTDVFRIAETANIFQHFLDFMMKLLYGAHQANSSYELLHFTDRPFSMNQFYDKVLEHFPNGRIETSDGTWHPPKPFKIDFVMIPISKKLELQVYKNTWKYMMRVNRVLES